MNEREELLKKLNEDFQIKQNEQPVATYRATTNFNTALSNPNMTMNNATNVNIKSNEEINSSMSVNNLLEPTKEVPNQPQKQVTVEPNNQVNNITNNQTNNETVNQANIEQVQNEQNLDVTEKFYEEQPIYDMQTNYTKTYISNQDINKKKKITIKMSKDTQVLILIVIIIFIFIMILPVLP
ncbi:MAG: hypothetical protein MRZ37_00735 [Tenericutes bacterium]|nr:hypothetical protein [Mycoplasmatota bacterium]